MVNHCAISSSERTAGTKGRGFSVRFLLAGSRSDWGPSLRRAEFSVSNDGAHLAMFRYRDKNDVYMIRNFGQLLR